MVFCGHDPIDVTNVDASSRVTDEKSIGVLQQQSIDHAHNRVNLYENPSHQPLKLEP